jgi:hypothetical protein
MDFQEVQASHEQAFFSDDCWGCPHESDGNLTSDLLGHDHLVEVDVQDSMGDDVALRLSGEGQPGLVSVIDPHTDQPV